MTSASCCCKANEITRTREELLTKNSGSLFRSLILVGAVAACFLVFNSAEYAVSARSSGVDASGSSAASPDSNGWYTSAQAASGAKSYKKICAGCHGATLQGGGAPALVGKPFWLNYAGKKVSTLWSTVHSEMPMTAPGSVSATNSINIMAFILQKNGLPSGAVPLDDTTDLSKVLPAK